MFRSWRATWLNTLLYLLSMKKRHVLLIAVAVAGTAFNSPKNVEAAATKLTDNTGLYTIDFEFQAGTEAYRIPVGAMAGLTYGDDSNYLGYRIGDDKKRASGVVSNGLVLSTQPIVDGYYEVPAGERGKFTMVTLVTVPEEPTMYIYRTHVTHLPYLRGDERREVKKDTLKKLVSQSLLLNQEIHGDGYTLKVKEK